MNFNELQEGVWRWLGYHNAAQRRDHFRQEIRDALNGCLDQLYNTTPLWWRLLTTDTLALTSGTSDYQVSDMSIFPVQMWTEADYAHKVEFITPNEVDRLGLRAISLVQDAFGPYTFTFAADVATALKSMTCSIAEGSTTLTRTAGDTFDATDVGKRVRINGYRDIYLIETYTDANNVILDRAFKNKLTGEGVTGTGASLVGAPVEVSPPKRATISFKPNIGTDSTVYYSYIRRWRTMIGDTDQPDIDEKYHDGILHGARARMASFVKDQESVNAEAQLFAAAIKAARDENMPNLAECRVYYQNTIRGRRNRVFPPDVNYRGIRIGGIR